ncbi:MAG: YlxR family protein [Ruminococcaceae bacterium]|nr:YlxR family protein [Oscillospiraceae bacterium]
MNKTYIPTRTCIGCMKKFSQDMLLKVVRQKDGEVVLGLDNKTFGRGAYLCKNEKCIANAQKKSKLSRALRCEVESKVYDELFKMCGEDNG